MSSLTQRRRGAKTHLREHLGLLWGLGDFAPLREIFFAFQRFHAFSE
jgi:hypothetical protein